MKNVKCDEVLVGIASKNKMDAVEMHDEVCVKKCKSFRGKHFGICPMEKCAVIREDDERMMARLEKEKS